VNPVLLVEVTSASTEEYDRGDKLRHYKRLASVREVLFVSHRGPELTLHRREDAGWLVLTAGPGESLELASVAAHVEVDDIYRDGLEDAGQDPS
jgi:Uma2 family endonuclease